MTGCRCDEALHSMPHFDKSAVYVDRSKTDGTSGYVKISLKYAELLEKDWDTMFKHPSEYYSKKISAFLTDIGLPNKTLHDLRHTFSTNIFYLGCSQKEHQYFMGHKSIKMTYELYTKYDPFIEKPHIIDVWDNMYPDFAPNNAPNS